MKYNTWLSGTLGILSPYFLLLNTRMKSLLFYIQLQWSVTSFLWAAQTAKSGVSSYMPLRRGRNPVFLQLLGPLNTEQEPLPGLSVAAVGFQHFAAV